jgi:hypothetical protein
MTTASAQLSTTPATESPGTQALQDVLYDTLAVGVDSDASASTASAIETFLHEHARSPKSMLTTPRSSGGRGMPSSPSSPPVMACSLIAENQNT